MDLGPFAIPAIVAGCCLLFAALMFLAKGYRLLGIAMIPDDGIGIVTKKFGFHNSRMPDGRIIAINKEAGFQCDTLAPGLYWGFWPWQYSIENCDFFTVPQGQIGIVEARDGKPIPAGHVLARRVDCDSFQDARKFLTGGGMRGPQLDVMPPGTFRINTKLFSIQLTPAIVIPQGKVGIVTTLEGAPLANSEIAGPIIEGHNAFQDSEKFVAAGGKKGLQEQVVLAGMYYANPLFVRFELADLVDIPIGSVGVVVSFVGAIGSDTSGIEFTHGSIVKKGEKGVWAEPLDPGRYPVNPRIMRVEIVPTTNIVLNWATGKTEAHQLDRSLSTITVRSGDGFTFNLDVSQIIHVSRENAPKVIARFGTMVNLVTQVLEPTIGNYFRNSAQSSDVIEFLQKRAERQANASQFIAQALEKYNVQAVDTLIGDIAPPEALMTTLTDRKVAEQRKVTFGIQGEAEKQRQEFEQQKTEADTRGQVVAADRLAQIAKLNADAIINKATGDAGAKNINATADANVTLVNGQALATKTQLVGEAEAGVLKSKVDAVGAQFYALMNVVDQLSLAKTALVPQIMVGGGSNGDKPSLIDAFVGNLMANSMNGHAGNGELTPAAVSSRNVPIR